MTKEQLEKAREYLGDSVYAEFDGYCVVLTTNNGYPDDPRNLIGLEPAAINALLRYISMIENRFDIDLTSQY